MKGRYEGNYIPNGIYESGEKYDSTRLIDELMLVKDKSKEIRVVVNTNDYITSYPASLFDMSIKEGEDIAKDHFDNIIAIELYR